MKLRSKRTLTVAGTVVVLLALPLLWIARQNRQAEKDHALILAIGRSDAENVETLIASGANPNTLEALSINNTVVKRIRNLFQLVPSDPYHPVIFIPLQATDMNPSTFRIVNDLIAAGANVNLQDSGGGTPLTIAAGNGQAKCIKALINAHADVNYRNRQGATPLIRAVQSGSMDSINALIAVHADVNKADNRGQTPLMLGASIGRTDFIRTLVAAGADVNKQDTHGETALMRTAYSGSPDVVKALIAARADIKMKSGNGSPHSQTRRLATAYRRGQATKQQRNW